MRRYSISVCSMELLNQLIISTDLGYIKKDQLVEIREHIELISTKLNSLSNYFKKLKYTT